jgi:hypothetical protein
LYFFFKLSLRVKTQFGSSRGLPVQSVPKSCKFESRSWRGVLDTPLCDKVCQWPTLFTFIHIFYCLDYNNIWLYFFFKLSLRVRVRVMVFSATFNNISVISWRSVLLVEESSIYMNIYITINLNRLIILKMFLETTRIIFVTLMLTNGKSAILDALLRFLQ